MKPKPKPCPKCRQPLTENRPAKGLGIQWPPYRECSNCGYREWIKEEKPDDKPKV